MASFRNQLFSLRIGEGCSPVSSGYAFITSKVPELISGLDSH